MSELSPQAQAVLDAVKEICPAPADEIAAAALRAAADQVVPEENVDEADYDCLQAKWVDQGKQEARAQILAIVTELENHQ